jgi:hypothetical protein
MNILIPGRIKILSPIMYGLSPALRSSSPFYCRTTIENIMQKIQVWIMAADFYQNYPCAQSVESE